MIEESQPVCRLRYVSSLLAIALLVLLLLIATAPAHADEEEPIEVLIGLKMDQITDVDEKTEDFSIVGSLRMEWTDTALAYSPEECDCTVKLFRDAQFADFLNEQNILWPAATIFNQQGRRFSQTQLVALYPEGRAVYFERFTATIQAPDLDFRSFPFDSQQFYVLVDLLLPEDLYQYGILEGFSGVGEHLGEEEWNVTGFDTAIGSQEYGSRFSFTFDADRSQGYYITRILAPLGLIILVSWVTFFLKDYIKRIEITGANLLLFIAFNFAIASDLPRLGYLTFIDSIMMATFVMSALVVVFNVVLRRLDISGRGELAQRLDSYTIWLYPLAYAVMSSTVAMLFL